MAARQYQDERAHALRAAYYTAFGGKELPVPVASIAEDLLGLLVEQEPLRGVSGLIYPAERRIVLNAADVAARRRFTLAHELGHWTHHCAGPDAAPVFCRAVDETLDAGTRAQERTANIFAAELLMPEDAMRAAWSGSVAAAADRFGVSGLAMHWRAYSFGLVAERPPAQ
jgi:Zn-dependent peptidase ImmA (M78 family)